MNSEEIIICSDNQGKIEEIKDCLSFLDDIDILSKKEAGIITNIDEVGQTFRENAKLKAETIYKRIQTPVIADDSGLCVDALNGEPGIYSARYAGENKSDTEKCLFLLNKMNDIKDLEERTCHFVACICYIDQNGDAHYFEGYLDGYIAFELRGQNGHGYDPIFSLSNGKHLSELSTKEKNKISHRGQAIRMFADYIKKHGL